MRAEDEHDGPSVHPEDRRRRGVADLDQELPHPQEVLAEIELGRLAQKIDPPIDDRQRDGALVEEGHVPCVGVVGRQEPLPVVVDHVLVGPARNPAQRVDSDSKLVLQVVELGLDLGIEGEIVASLVPDRLVARRTLEQVVPAVMPGDRHRTSRREGDRSAARADRETHRVERVVIDCASREDIRAVVVTGARLNVVAAIAEERRPDDSLVGRRQRPVTVHVGQVGEKRRVLRVEGVTGLTDTAQHPSKGDAGGPKETPSRRIRRVAGHLSPRASRHGMQRVSSFYTSPIPAARGESAASHRGPANRSHAWPGQGATTENVGSLRARSNAGRQDASPAECRATFTTGC